MSRSPVNVVVSIRLVSGRPLKGDKIPPPASPAPRVWVYTGTVRRAGISHRRYYAFGLILVFAFPVVDQLGNYCQNGDLALLTQGF